MSEEKLQVEQLEKVKRELTDNVKQLYEVIDFNNNNIISLRNRNKNLHEQIKKVQRVLSKKANELKEFKQEEKEKRDKRRSA